MFLTDQQTQDFNDLGFVVLRRFFDPPAMAKISAWLDELRDREPAEGAEAKYYEESPITGERILVRIEHLLGEVNPEMTALIVCPRVVESLTQLFGEPPLLFKEKANYKLPGCRADKLHQDQAAGWNGYADFFISMAVIVDENRLDNAALSIMSSGRYERALMGEEWQVLSQDDPPYAPADQYTLLEADPGDVVFFDSYVPHGSPANTSNRSRRNLFLTFNRASAGDLRDRYYREKWESFAPNASGAARPAEAYRV